MYSPGTTHLSLKALSTVWNYTFLCGDLTTAPLPHWTKHHGSWGRAPLFSPLCPPQPVGPAGSVPTSICWLNERRDKCAK